MTILADTQILVWSLDVDSPLSTKHRAILADAGNKVFTSHIRLMELVIKKAIGKLPDFVPNINEVAALWMKNGYEILPLTDNHIFTYQSIPFLEEHRDPFDRFIIAAAKAENFVVMTEDKKFQLYSSIIQVI